MARAKSWGVSCFHSAPPPKVPSLAASPVPAATQGGLENAQAMQEVPMAASGSAGDGGHAPQAATRQPASPPSLLQKLTGAVICGAGTLPKTTGATSTSVALASRVARHKFAFAYVSRRDFA